MLHAKTWMNEGKFEKILVNRNFNPFVAVGHFHIETGSAASKFTETASTDGSLSCF